jgi:Ca-activated chloride channel family protein
MSVQWTWPVPVGLGAAALVAAAAWWWGRRTRSHGLAVAHSARLTALPRYQLLARRHRRLLVAMSGASLVLVVAVTMLAARPVRSQRAVPEVTSRDIMLCLDVSGSMVEYNRSVLEQFGRLLEDFDGERVGLTIFNASAVTVFPLTTDYGFITDEFAKFRATFEARGIDTLAGTLEGDGSSLVPDGIASCALSFPDEDEDRSRSVVVATDNQVEGVTLTQMPEVTGLMQDRGIRVYAIYPLFTFESRERPETVEIRDLANGSGGAFFGIDNTQATQWIVERIDRSEATRLETEATLIRFAEPSVWLAVAALAAAALVVLAWRAGA